MSKSERVHNLLCTLWQACIVMFDSTNPDNSPDPKADWEAIKFMVGCLDDCTAFDGTKYTSETFLAELAKSGSLCPDYVGRKI